ncbi:hypothetical protein [Rhodopseudomonas pseudopalustris]|uniref:Uncharacterized protein n=2 Tax=Rhodopseudomonas TaxID=1073 RepID=Q13DL5_RHOPS|nr:hypothetical protein [Rhodopseudomonas pseudopalustris]ABE37824.1 hypothetical protein RPD_0586 [Rhodopseudomonas palustris BisB5]MBB1091537.1 hypothetical protein [Rhodopseudomonas palustris]SEP23919.1 hypothetical protein SAMN05444123_11194 [Rhodopseudomonas pseudopalustris]
MLAHRYIQAVLARDLAEEIKQDADAFEKSERAVRAEEHRERAEQLSFRFIDLDRRFGI